MIFPAFARQILAACKRARSTLLLLTIGLAAAMLLPLGTSACCDPKSPYRAGEGYAETAATCETISYWAGRAPKTDGRISMTIKGKLSKVIGTDVLAYLEMCDSKGLQVVCVTYQTNGMKAGEVVTFGGGYQSSSDKWVVLDPCLAYRE